MFWGVLVKIIFSAWAAALHILGAVRGKGTGFYSGLNKDIIRSLDISIKGMKNLALFYNFQARNCKATQPWHHERKKGRKKERKEKAGRQEWMNLGAGLGSLKWDGPGDLDSKFCSASNSLGHSKEVLSSWKKSLTWFFKPLQVLIL